MSDVPSTIGRPAVGPPLPQPVQDAALKEAAKGLEATFLAEMLKSAKVGETPDAFGGGPGEDQFASFLRQAHAEEMVNAGGIGLSEALFEALKDQS